MRTFNSRLFKNLVGCFSGNNLIWHVSAIVLTYVLVAGGFDWWYFEATRSAVLQSILFPAAMIGGVVGRSFLKK